MSFAEVRLEDGFIVYRTVGGPMFNTNIVVVNSGRESRNKNWDKARGRWEFGERKMTSKELHNTVAFFRARGGRYQGFRFKDWGDYKVTATQLDEYNASTQGVMTLLTTDTAQLQKVYFSGDDQDVRDIRKPVEDSVTVYVAGVEAAVEIDYTTGIVTFGASPGDAELTWAGQFDTPVRFDTDDFKYQLLAGTPTFTDPPDLADTYYFVHSLPIIETRED